MYGTFIWWVFCVPLHIRMLLLCLLFSTTFCVLNRQRQPFSSQVTCFLHVQGDGFQRGQVFANGERSKRVLTEYNRTTFFDITLSGLTTYLIRSLQIGGNFPRKRSRPGGSRKQKLFKQVSQTPPSSLSTYPAIS